VLIVDGTLLIVDCDWPHSKRISIFALCILDGVGGRSDGGGRMIRLMILELMNGTVSWLFGTQELWNFDDEGSFAGILWLCVLVKMLLWATITMQCNIM
jgi:hypothetical protein